MDDLNWRDLAERFGTPAYVYDGDALARRVTALREALPDLEVFFSLKSNPNPAVYGVLRSHGARAEVSSLAELTTVLAAGTPPEDVLFLGPGKSEGELAACVDHGLYAIVCESFQELAAIDRLAGGRGVRQRVMLRINPAYSVSGSRLTMGGKPRQFGIDEAAVLAAGDLVERHPHVDVVGVQAYLGTRILDADVVVGNTTYILDLSERVATALGIRLEAVDIGGGLGVPYFDGEEEFDLKALRDKLTPLLAAFRAAHPDTRLIMEAGRYLTADAGTYLMEVRYTKESMGEWFAVTDGGTHHHMAAVGIGSFVKRNFPIELLARGGGDGGTDAPAVPAVDRWTVTGPLCTPNDTIGKKVALPGLAPGDLLGVRRSGAYGPSASPVLFLSHGYPAEVLVTEDGARLVRDRDTTEDLLAKYRP
ncbi:type III PLP-dependent enzyme [Streptomyces sp. OfavH-34-F]|uniref:type III PLP-dependent enzyme n=1 Tax=Streptomyces sp. OfavH-34-F TaxID=2917760 RepID=UPI0035AF5285